MNTDAFMGGRARRGGVPAGTAQRRITTELRVDGSVDVLVVDDQLELRETAIESLALAGYTANGAPDGATAVRLLEEGPPPGLILLDIDMPVMDGWEFLRLRASSPTLARVPVIVFSSQAEPPGEHGVAGWLDKPASEEALIAAVEVVLRTFRARTRRYR